MTSRRHLVSAVALAATVALGAPVAGQVARAEVPAPVTTLEASIDPTTVTALPGRLASMSGDGRLVVFVAAGSDGRARSIYLRDRELGSLVELTEPAAGMRTGSSTAPAISSDGCVVAIVTEIPFDLFRDDDRGDRWDVYRMTLPACGGSLGEWELVSGGPGGALDRANPAWTPSLSASGQVLAFVLDDLSHGPVPHSVWVADMTVPLGEGGRLVAAPGLPAGVPGGAYAYTGQVEPALSGDGGTLVFTTDATIGADGRPVWADGEVAGGRAVTQVLLWQRSSGQLPAPVSVTLGGSADQPAISGDGRVIAYRSVGGGVGQVHAVDRDGDSDGVFDEVDDRSVEVVSAVTTSFGTTVGDGPSSSPSVSNDGEVVAFVTRAANLLPVPVPGSFDPDDGTVVLSMRRSGQLLLASRRSDGASPAAAANAHPVLSATGRAVLYDTAAASEIVAGTPSVVGRQIVVTTFPTSLAMQDLDVGSVPINWPSPGWYLVLENESTSTFVPSMITVSDPAFGVTGGTCQVLVPVAPGGFCTLTLVFVPQAPGPVDATLTVAELGFGAASVSVRLQGDVGEPSLSALPAGLDLGAAVVGTQTDAAPVEVTNAGFAPVQLGAASIGGGAPDDFHIERDACSGRALPVGATCTIEVRGAPTADGVRNALLVVPTSVGQRTSVLLTARGERQPVVMALASVVAGQGLDVLVGALPPNSPVTISLEGGMGSITVTSDANGAVAARLPVARNERPGLRRVVVADAAERFAPVSTTVTVLMPSTTLSGGSPVRAATRP